MISVKEARELIKKNVQTLPMVSILLSEAGTSVLAEDVLSQTDIPAFNQSSMDGYAFHFQDWTLGTGLAITGVSAAGDAEQLSVSGARAVRIFTGAPVPRGTDTVVMQEKTNEVNGVLTILDEQLEKGANVRLQGTDIKKGQTALTKGTLLTPAALGFLAGCGIDKLSIYRDPVITIILTGKELQEPGIPLQFGQVYESNSYALKAGLSQLHIFSVKTTLADDNLAIVKDRLEKALENSDLVIVTGGISVGDYDFVLQAAELCGVEKVFHRIKQRPGKPLYFGKKKEKYVFGLPGNPASVLTCFYQYVVPAIEMMRGNDPEQKKIIAPLAKAVQKPSALTCFLKGYYDGIKAMPLNAQESYRLSSFALANCLIQVDEGRSNYDKGEIVSLYMITQ